MHNLDRITGAKLYLSQFWAILVKKFRLTYRNLQLFISTLYPICLPVLLIIYLSIILNQILTTTSFTIDTYNLKQTLGKSQCILGTNELSQENDLFRLENQKWLKEEFGLTFKNSETDNITKIIDDELKQVGLDRFRRDFVFSPIRYTDRTYYFYLNNLKTKYTTVASLDLFYRSVAREAKKDFNVNLKFSYIETPNNLMKSLTKSIQLVVLKPTFMIFSTIVFTIIFSFPFVAFVEVLHDEMNSGVSIKHLGISLVLHSFILNF